MFFGRTMVHVSPTPPRTHIYRMSSITWEETIRGSMDNLWGSLKVRYFCNNLGEQNVWNVIFLLTELKYVINTQTICSSRSSPSFCCTLPDTLRAFYDCLPQTKRNRVGGGGGVKSRTINGIFSPSLNKTVIKSIFSLFRSSDYELFTVSEILFLLLIHYELL